MNAEIIHKALPVAKIFLVMYSTAIGVLWAAIRLVAPAGYEFSLGRAVGAVFVLAVAGNSFHTYLGPVVGGWYLFFALLAYVPIVKICFELPLWRSAMIAVIYFGTVAVVYHFMFARLAH